MSRWSSHERAPIRPRRSCHPWRPPLRKKPGVAGSRRPTAFGVDLSDFLFAASQGALVWAVEEDGRAVLRGGARTVVRGGPDIRDLFLAALRERFGAAATAIAEREIDAIEAVDATDRRGAALRSRTILRGAACAESALTMLMAQATVLQIEFSAEMFGVRFVQRCVELSIEPGALSLDRRRSIDAAMADCFSAPAPSPLEEAHRRLGELLQPTLH